MQEFCFIIYENIKITDWIKAFGVLLGIPITIVSIYKLFQKNKSHSEQIGKLSELVTSQNAINESLKDQLTELKKHTQELHNKNLFKIDENKMTEESLEIELNRYADDTIIKYDELKIYVIQQLKNLKEPIEHQIEKFGSASISLAERKNNGFQFTVDPSLRVSNIVNLNNEDLFKVFVRNNTLEQDDKIELYINLEKAISFIQYMEDNLPSDISTIYERYQNHEEDWNKSVSLIRVTFESYVNKNIKNGLVPGDDGFVDDLDDVFANWRSQDGGDQNIRDTYFMIENLIEPLRILCNKHTPDSRCDLLLPYIVNANVAFHNIDNLKALLKKVFDNYIKNLSRSLNSIEDIIKMFEKTNKG